jgi:hypothetical protein
MTRLVAKSYLLLLKAKEPRMLEFQRLGTMLQSSDEMATNLYNKSLIGCCALMLICILQECDS